ncbi:MAG TPA: Mrp/NBP35 family ATP-binding protein [Pyrinomonadaceae bacterium]|nr:Mrp/NBP35 family ATP-binding protein [Pyrinomonadaceae bacterium]
MAQITEQSVLAALGRVRDPDLHKDIVTLGFVRDLRIDGGEVSFRIVLTTPACPVREQLQDEARRVVSEIPGVSKINVTMDAEVPKGRGIGDKVVVPGVRNIVAVSSGKGGVGKSTVAVNLAVSLALDGARVGLMDADVYGPNVPLMLGAGNVQPQIEGNKLLPVVAHGVKMMSMAILKPGDEPMIVRGPILHGLVRQFLQDVKWGELDYLIVDMPPGTGDVQLSLAQLVPVQGAVMVTTPQEVALADAYHVALLGQVPLGLEVREGGDKGVPVVVSHPESVQARAFRRAAEEVARYVSIEAMKPELKIVMTKA